ncbi:30S ribosomal protein S7 [bacterium]|nr:30S ribosomal protein S7 [bacterium]
MPRRGEAPRRVTPGDPIYGSPSCTRVINKLMLGGKKVTAERIFYGALQIAAERTGKNPLEVFTQAMRNVTPQVEVRPRRVGGATYQVPIEVTSRRQTTLSVRWLVGEARKRPERRMVERLANEIIDASNREGGAVKKREDVHRMAEANKAYSHYRW